MTRLLTAVATIPRERRDDHARPRHTVPLHRLPELADSLQRVLVDLIALQLQAKQAHWNVVGPGFRNLHLQLDAVVDLAREGSDTTAERMRALGATPDGREGTVAATTTLTAFPDGEQETSRTVELVTARITATASTIRTVHDRVDDEDPTSADLLHALLADLEKQAWMIAAEMP
ncbi:DNA starvation/stationary phase protection protein [Streptacidiphilus sp. 4-A2]|nr:DNA starvation/stationary phase protection protein [Streptacidiphilus sp. 4-A2]